MRVYVSEETHTWIQKAADLFGLGTDSVRWIPTDRKLRIDVDALRGQIAADPSAGDLPLLVVGAAGTVATGAVDPLEELADICRDEEMWFHVDGAYGAFAAAVPGAPPDLRGLAGADSVAVDPHKWLYVPVEAGCALVRRPEALLETFSYRPDYYHLAREDEEERINYFEYGPQNSRAFRALKVWLALRHVGRDAYVETVAEDIELARHLHGLVEEHPSFEAGTTSLSITTFRYVPDGVARDDHTYLNELNSELVTRLEQSGEAFVSNAVVDGKFFLRACIVNFRTSMDDVEALPGIAARLGAEVHADLRSRVPG